MGGSLFFNSISNRRVLCSLVQIPECEIVRSLVAIQGLGGSRSARGPEKESDKIVAVGGEVKEKQKGQVVQIGGLIRIWYR